MPPTRVPLTAVDVVLGFDRVHADDCLLCDEREEGWIQRIQTAVTLHGNFDEAQSKRLAQVAARCPVHKTLANGVATFDEVTFVPAGLARLSRRSRRSAACGRLDQVQRGRADPFPVDRRDVDKLHADASTWYELPDDTVARDFIPGAWEHEAEPDLASDVASFAHLHEGTTRPDDGQHPAYRRRLTDPGILSQSYLFWRRVVLRSPIPHVPLKQVPHQDGGPVYTVPLGFTPDPASPG
jgi:hypothetical protein